MLRRVPYCKINKRQSYLGEDSVIYGFRQNLNHYNENELFNNHPRNIDMMSRFCSGGPSYKI